MEKVQLVTALLSLLALACAASPTAGLGSRGGRLAPCPATPNCVSSQDADPGHAVAPLPYAGTPQAAVAVVKAIVAGMPRARVVEESGGYVRAEFRSLVFRFTDDVEFLVDDAHKVVHVRSAARVGRSDLGVNRARVERIRARWEALRP